MTNKYLYALDLLPIGLKNAVERLCLTDLMSLSEIRLRAGEFLTVKVMAQEYLVTYGGKLSESSANAVRVFKNDVTEVFNRAFEGSVYSFERELKNGFITTAGGNRVAFSSSFVYENGEIKRIGDVTGVSIRIAREIPGCANDILDRICFSPPKSVLICGAPGCGKTTVLRDLARQLGNCATVALIDERGELASVHNGELQNDVGRFTDVLSGVTKAEGVIRAVRLLSPVYIITDEIGQMSDLSAFEYAQNSGVKLIATTHASSAEDALKKPLIKKLIKRGFFDYSVFISQSRKISEVKEVRQCLRV